jgi:hypothetical protein
LCKPVLLMVERETGGYEVQSERNLLNNARIET